MNSMLRVVALLIALGLGCGSAPRPEPMIPAREAIVYPAAKILTMNPAQPVATAVAIANGRIVGVGSVASLSQQLADFQLRIDGRFKHKVLLPGLIENHLHPIMAAVLLPMEWVTPYDWDLPDRKVIGVVGQDAYLARLRALDETYEAGKPLFAWGYHPLFHGELSRADLNEISTDRPIIAWHRSFHEVILNDAALQWLQLSEADVAGHHQIDWERGHFYETGLYVAVSRMNPTILAPEWIARGLALVRDTVHQGGITTIGDMAAGNFHLETEWPALKQHLGGDEIPFNTYFIPAVGGLELQAGSPEAAFSLIESLPERNTRKLQFLRQVKVFSDGAFFSQLAQMSGGYLDGHHGEWLMTPEVLLKTTRPYWNAGYQIHVHVTGDLGVKSALDTLETLQGEHPRVDHRYTLHHYGYGTEAQSQRVAEAGAYVSANPFYLYQMSDIYSEVGFGPERAERISPLGSLVKAGVPVSLHSDFSMAPAAPLRLASVAVNRRAASGRVMAPEERLSVEQALRAVTLDAARAIQLEDEIGSVEVGKIANLTVLQDDPMQVAPEALADIAIWGTVFEGRLFPLGN